MSESFRYQLQQLASEELIDFALEHLGQEYESIRQLALQEHFLRVKDASSTVRAPAGDVQILRSQFAQLLEPQPGTWYLAVLDGWFERRLCCKSCLPLVSFAVGCTAWRVKGIMWYRTDLLFAQLSKEGKRSVKCETRNVLFDASSAAEVYDQAVCWAATHVEDSLFHFVGVEHISSLDETQPGDRTEIGGMFFDDEDVWERKNELIPEKVRYRQSSWSRTVMCRSVS